MMFYFILNKLNEIKSISYYLFTPTSYSIGNIAQNIFFAKFTTKKNFINFNLFYTKVFTLQIYK